MQFQEFITAFHHANQERGITREEARAILESAFTIIARKLEAGDSVMILNFGKFEARHRRERLIPAHLKYQQGREGEVHPAWRVTKFTTGRGLYNLLNPHCPRTRKKPVDGGDDGE
jgi:nucleoid DNA-binding protein